MNEQVTIVVYDITNNRFRKKAADRCLDFGLKRFQYSSFTGKMTKTRRRELLNEIIKYIKASKEPGRVLILPLCEKDFEQMLSFEKTEEEDDEDDPGLC